MKKIYFLLLCCFCMICSLAQNENTKWYFGKNAALDFMTNPPTILNNSVMSVVEGCSGIADGAGNLLFYTDGITVYNQQHVAMANGTGLAGGSSATQAALILKQPSGTLYYIFTVNHGGQSGLYYSIVDMSLAAGMGSVTVKNAAVYSSPCCEKLAATIHCNGIDYWVMIHEFGSNNFRAYLLTSSGVSASPVVSSAGTPYTTLSGTATAGYQGEMKFSPTGQKIGCTNTNTGSNTGGFVELYDFDKSTGVVSNALTLPSIPSNTFQPYGCEFSPDGTKFYAGTGYAHPSNLNLYSPLIQWNLNAGSNSSILSSSVVIYGASNVSFGSMQLAPNGKIYISTAVNSQSLCVINNPNAAGTGCNFVYGGQAIAVTNVNTNSLSLCLLGLPNMLSSFLSSTSPCSLTSSPCNISFVVQRSNILCNSTTGSASITNLSGNQGGVGYLWSNGLVTYTTAQVNNLTAGVWSVTVTDALNCSSSQTFAITQISVLTPSISSGSSNNICAGNSVTLTAGGAITYTWNTGAQGSIIIDTPANVTQYFVSATDANGCTSNSATLTINVVSAPELTVSGNLNICIGNSSTLIASGANSYTWNNGVQTSSVLVNSGSATQYTVLGASQSGCVGAAAVTINIVPPPTLTVSGTFTLCSPHQQTLTVSGASSYLWKWDNTTAFATSTFLIINPLATNQYSITGTNELGCKNTKIVTVSIITCTDIDKLSVESSELKVYPNPVSEILNIEFVSSNKVEDLIIYDMLGKEIIQEELKIKNSATSIDLKELPRGVYFIKVGSEVRRFVKE